MRYVIPFSDINMNDLAEVGGKNASLGEMTQHLINAGIKVPQGFATTASAYREFLHNNQLESEIEALLKGVDLHDVNALTLAAADIRQRILASPLPKALEQAIRSAYSELNPNDAFSVAVRSSATSEDLPEASFAGQQETVLNVAGISDVLDSVKRVFASLYNGRAISYRAGHGFSHTDIALSAGIQQMVRSDLGASGVAFSIDTESGFDKVVFVTSSYGLGEAVVSGDVNPDEFYVYKPNLQAQRPAVIRKTLGDKAKKIIFADPSEDGFVKTVPVPEKDRLRFSLSNNDIEKLAKKVLAIEQHYKRPVDVEWGKDGNDGDIYILQARPETVKSRQDEQVLSQFTLTEKGTLLVNGRSVGQKIGQGAVRLIANVSEMPLMQDGEVLVTDMTDPDWEPIMKKAAAIVTNRGGRTCHAAIIARELGIPAVVGCGNATDVLNNGDIVTVSCAEGETGTVYSGRLRFRQETIKIKEMPTLPFDIYMNLGNPEKAFAFQSLPNAGVGLARIEFIITDTIGIHPAALLNTDNVEPSLKQAILDKTAAYATPVDYYVKRLQEGVATIAAAFYPKPVIVRFSDFKSDEYAALLGGELYEPNEDNPMLGYRGASRYVDAFFQPCFALECQAIKAVREQMGFTNVQVMVPFVRTVTEAKKAIDTMAANGLHRGENGLKVIMMCEIPSNALLADAFLDYFDGFSIGSNDLTQLTLGLDRNSSMVAGTFDERDAAVKILLEKAITACRKTNKYVGICGQGPSDHPDLALWLIEQGISSISLVPDSIISTWMYLANKEKD